MARRCSCGGSNEECSWCSGTGVVEEALRTPGQPVTKRSNGHQVEEKTHASRRAPRSPVVLCPRCGIALLSARLDKHLRKAHPASGESQTSASRTNVAAPPSYSAVPKKLRRKRLASHPGPQKPKVGSRNARPKKGTSRNRMKAANKRGRPPGSVQRVSQQHDHDRAWRGNR